VITKEKILFSLLSRVKAEIDLKNVKLRSNCYYASLPFAVIDSVFSVGVRYEVVINVVSNFGLRVRWPIYREYGSAYPNPGSEHSIDELLACFGNMLPLEAADKLFNNRGLSNPAARNPTLKSGLVQQVARVLSSNGIQRFADLQNYHQLGALNDALRTLPSLSSGVVTSHLQMLCSSEYDVKPSRHLSSYIRTATAEPGLLLNNEDIVDLVQAAAQTLSKELNLPSLTPRLLEYSIWKAQKKAHRYSRISLTPTSAEHSIFQPNFAHENQRPSKVLIDEEKFWEFCLRGGSTHTGLEFSVDDHERLHIVSPRSLNGNYKISRQTVKKYLSSTQDPSFRQNHGWFCNIYDFSIRTQNDNVPHFTG